MEDEELEEVCEQCGMVHDGAEGVWSLLFVFFFMAFVFLIFHEASLN